MTLFPKRVVRYMTESSLETYLTKHPELKLELHQCSDSDLAGAIRGVVDLMNVMVIQAAKRELIVTYRIKDGVKGDGLTNPRVVVNVTTEVI